MKKHINDIYNQIEDWRLVDLERLHEELENLIDIVEAETCEDCGNRPFTGACFHCRQD